MDYIQYQEHQIRCINHDGRTLYRALDISNILGITYNPLARGRYVKQKGINKSDLVLVEEPNGRSISRTQYVPLQIMAIMASGAYDADANTFRDWVFNLMETQTATSLTQTSNVPQAKIQNQDISLILKRLDALETRKSFWRRLFNA